CHPCIERYNEEFGSSDKSHLAEGCFCPNGTMLSSPHSDICVSSCDCIGPDGTPKKLGESWRSNCHDCVCDEASMSVQCQPHVCPVPPKLPCTQEGQVLVTGPMANDSCCNTTTCKCDLSRCPKAEKSCEPGFKPVAQPSEQGCCPVYKCEPRNVCVLNNIEYQVRETLPPPRATRPTTITHEGCVSSTTVEVSSCEGACSTYSMYSSEANAMQHKCSCCQELSTSQRNVTLQCADGSSVPYTYTHIEECGCKDTRCQDSYSDLLLVTASRGRK
ncbi:MUC2 protein, partial [Atractosteus spatula]|nr:MUC2 protein [Atractosteus spatula]